MSKTFSPTDHFWPSVVTERQSNLNRLTAEEAVLQPETNETKSADKEQGKYHLPQILLAC